MAYDEILRSGKRIYCISTDDNHNRGDEPAHDSFGGFTMIKAEKLEYETGDFNEFGYISYHGALSLDELMMEGAPSQYQQQSIQMGGM